jgi:hypothetical protein
VSCVPQQPYALPHKVVAPLAVTCGLAVANLYYVQPLLNEVGAAFGVGETVTGLLVTASQVGYVPLASSLAGRRSAARSSER